MDGSPAKRKTEVSASSVSNPVVSLWAHVVSAIAPLVHIGRADRLRPKAWTVPLQKKRGVVEHVEIRERNFNAHGSDFTAQWGRSVGAFLHIPRGREGRAKNERQRGGGCAKPLRGQAPVTPNSLILRSFHLATRYKSGDFVERGPREMANLPESQIFIT